MADNQRFWVVVISKMMSVVTSTVHSVRTRRISHHIIHIVVGHHRRRVKVDWSLATDSPGTVGGFTGFGTSDCRRLTELNLLDGFLRMVAVPEVISGML